MTLWTSDDIFDAVEKVAAASGHSKRLFLHTEMMQTLVAAYNPYTRYYTKRKEEHCVSDGTGHFTENTWLLLARLSERMISGHQAEQIVDEEISRLTPKSSRLFIRILNKDLRMGMGAKTINKVFNNLIPQHDIMLAKRVEWHRVKYPCWASFKVDGVRAKFMFGEFYSRKGIKYEGLDHLKKQLSGIRTALDGELIVPDVSFQVSSGMIRSNNSTPDAVFQIFELPDIKDPFPTRAVMMEDMMYYSPHVTALKQEAHTSKREVLESYEVARRCGYEGLIIRPYDYQYVGSRSYNWMKVKPLMKDLELRIISAYEGTGKYQGMLGGLNVEYRGSKGMQIVGVGSGFTDSQRAAYWDNPPIGKTMQAEAMEETDDGSLRHPIFKEIKE